MVSKVPHDTRSQLDEDVETYLTLGDKLAGLKKAQTEIREKKILPAVEKLGLEIGEFFEGEVEVDDETRQWSLTKFPGAKRLNASEFKRHLVEAGVKPAVVKAAEAKATKPGKPTVKIQWRAGDKDESGDEEDSDE